MKTSELQSLEIGRLVIWLRMLESATTLLAGVQKLNDQWNDYIGQDKIDLMESRDQLLKMFGMCVHCVVTDDHHIDDERAADFDDHDKNFGY